MLTNCFSSSANAKKWEIELSTLKNNNARLTSALQESTANVEEWKRQLHSYKEENTRLKVGFIELEAGRGKKEYASAASCQLQFRLTPIGNCDLNAMSELRNLKSRIEELENDLRERDEEVKQMKEQQNATANGAGQDKDSVVRSWATQPERTRVLYSLLHFQALQMENETLKKTLEKIQSQLDTSLDAQDQQKKVLEAINRQFGESLQSLGQLQSELTAVLNT